jgi:NAD-dependent dihydropyrimidine dehydrogenase PreA subunit
VWTDLFQHVDRLIDGDRNAQMKLAKAPWGPAKITRRLVKWSIYLLISISTGGAWIFYFADAPTLAREFVTLQAPSIAYSTVFVLTVTTMWFGGFMREQVCIYMCPWPRIQSAMLDEKSLLVTYKDWRGEPRGKKAADGKPLGDCVDCGLCAAVCPTGIDIREGPQIGCITCALCIDACDGVMEKTGRPRGLIDYVTLEDAAREINGQPATPHWKLIWHARTLIYLGIWSAIGAACCSCPWYASAPFHRGQQGPQSALYDPVQRRHPQRLCGALEEYGGPPTQDAVGAGRTSGRKNVERGHVQGNGRARFDQDHSRRQHGSAKDLCDGACRNARGQAQLYPARARSGWRSGQL